MKQYIRIYGKNGVYVFPEKELEVALERENDGVAGDIIDEENFVIDSKLDRKINDEL